MEVAAGINDCIRAISVDAVRRALKNGKKGKAFGSDDIAVETWGNLGYMPVRFLTRLFN